jgi:hypothetical protein
MMAKKATGGDDESATNRQEGKRWAAQLLAPTSTAGESLIAPDTARGDNEVFSRAEVVAAYSLFLPRKKAERSAAELFEPPPPGTEGLYTHFGDDVLDLLSLVSDDCAGRVRKSFGIGAEEAAERRARMRNRLQQRGR